MKESIKSKLEALSAEQREAQNLAVKVEGSKKKYGTAIRESAQNAEKRSAQIERREIPEDVTGIIEESSALKKDSIIRQKIHEESMEEKRRKLAELRRRG